MQALPSKVPLASCRLPHARPRKTTQDFAPQSGALKITNSTRAKWRQAWRRESGCRIQVLETSKSFRAGSNWWNLIGCKVQSGHKLVSWNRSAEQHCKAGSKSRILDRDLTGACDKAEDYEQCDCTCSTKLFEDEMCSEMNKYCRIRTYEGKLGIFRPVWPTKIAPIRPSRFRDCNRTGTSGFTGIAKSLAPLGKAAKRSRGPNAVQWLPCSAWLVVAGPCTSDRGAERLAPQKLVSSGARCEFFSLFPPHLPGSQKLFLASSCISPSLNSLTRACSSLSTPFFFIQVSFEQKSQDDEQGRYPDPGHARKLSQSARMSLAPSRTVGFHFCRLRRPDHNLQLASMSGADGLCDRWELIGVVGGLDGLGYREQILASPTRALASC
jgi:hypothetical protein